jgi:hypothetical protein
MMEHGAQEAAEGFILTGSHAWWFLGAWLVLMLAYGLWRSRGRGEQDPIRPSGPLE